MKKLSENRGQETGVVQLAPRKKKVGYIPTEPWLSCCGAGSVGFVLNVLGVSHAKSSKYLQIS